MKLKELEQAIISTILINPELINEHLSHLSLNLFSYYPHVINELLAMHNKNIIIDPFVLQDKMPEVDVYEFSNAVNTFRLPELFSSLVDAKIKKIAQDLVLTVNDKIKTNTETGQDILAYIDNTLKKVNELNVGNEYRDNTEIIKAVIANIEEAKKNKGITGIQTGLYEVDAVLRGLKDNNLIILAARPAMGKTTYSLQTAKDIAINEQKNVLFFSLEMSAEQLMLKLIADESNIAQDDLVNDAVIDFKQINSSISKLETPNLKIIDTCFTLWQIKGLSKKLKLKNEVDIIFIDYLQLIKGSNKKGQSREQEISEISRELKSLAMSLKVPIIALSQLSRAVESRADKMPQLSDLRESGSIEQDADVVMFLFRPAYYGFNEDADGNLFSSGHTSVLIKKNRHGKTADIAIQFMPELSRFVDKSYTAIQPSNDFEHLPY